MSLLLLCLKKDQLSSEEIKQIKSIVPDMDVIITRDKDKIRSVLSDVTIGAGWFPYEKIEEAASLKWLQLWFAGTDFLMENPHTVQKDFILTNGSGIHAVPISEHILSFLFAFARDLPQAIRAQDGKKWKYEGKGGNFELKGKTALIIGVGAIGSLTAKSLSALGVEVLGIRRNPNLPVSGVTRMYGQDKLNEALPKADFVINTVPLTEETRNMIGEKELQNMKDSSIFINIGRGGTVDEEALIEALQKGEIAGAGLDTFVTEPLPESSPLWEMENVIITGHYSGFTPCYQERAMSIFMENLKHYAAGTPMINVVNKKLGY